MDFLEYIKGWLIVEAMSFAVFTILPMAIFIIIALFCGTKTKSWQRYFFGVMVFLGFIGAFVGISCSPEEPTVVFLEKCMEARAAGLDDEAATEAALKEIPEEQHDEVTKILALALVIDRRIPMVFFYDGEERYVHPYRVGRTDDGVAKLRALEIFKNDEHIGEWKIYDLKKIEKILFGELAPFDVDPSYNRNEDAQISRVLYQVFPSDSALKLPTE